MGLSSAMSTGVSTINAGAYMTDVAAENIAASGAVAGKKRFALATTDNYNADPLTFTSGGISTMSFRDNNTPGAPVETGISTHFAIQGGGFAVVKDASTSEIRFTRNCTFATNNAQQLENSSGELLMVQPLTNAGVPVNPDTTTTAGLSVASIANLSGLAAATANITLPVILPQSTNAAETHSIPLTIVDSLGVNHTISVTFSNPISVAGQIQWTMSVAPPAVPGTDVIGAPYAGAGIPILFNPDGTLLSVNGAGAPFPALGVTWANGAAASNITMNLGTVGQSDGLSVNGTSFLASNIKIDGYVRGNYTGASYTPQGDLVVAFDNGTTQTIAKVPLATFANANGLLDRIGGSYQQTVQSGNYTLVTAGQGGSGLLNSNAYEGSTVDTTAEYTNLVNDQTLISGGVQVIRAAKDMMQQVLNILN